MDLVTLHSRTVANWQRTVEAVRPDQWDDPTPCTEWTVRDLVNHVVGEDLWTRPLLEGKTIAEVGDQFDGDVLGEDPVAKSSASAAEATAAAAEFLPAGGMVNVSWGQIPAEEYVRQLAADHLIHAWDLAVATGQSREMDAESVADVAAWFGPVEDMVRSAGVIAEHVNLTGDPQTELLAGYGRRADWQA